ncbi:hypothetical protein [Geodermatophilus sabuli]|uniref:Modulator of FtsH protease n=1 Tax=Geodermatophilus sabuli TaxID=1564158 RepID=A0A285EHH9_9ACTN|nr:hypothetical protein [Geodermatophilus sabuli]MBB3083884.1 modulator of FtsH protease [Geodermatophilus sabuli]SNX98535.1 modulator of FtsH protease [Geodermatophilus sabuli]
MDAYDAEAWSDFAVATVGACAALAGLIFVAVSINLARILEFPDLPGRAARSLGLLMALLVTCVLVLAPGQPVAVLGLEHGATGVLLAGSALPPLRGGRADPTAPAYRVLVHAAIVLVPAAALVACGATLLAGAGGGLYWLAAAVVSGLGGATANAWVLLVEIHR